MKYAMKQAPKQAEQAAAEFGAGSGDARHADSSAALLERLEQTAQRFESPCGDGHMVWHAWGSGPALVLLHGGAGSWRHWVRNIDFFARCHRVVAADLPGLGESALPPMPCTTTSLAALVALGVDMVLGPQARYDLVGFSFGGVISGDLALHHGTRLRSLTIVGSNGLGLERGAVALEKVRHLAGAARAAAHVVNLGRLMIADAAKIDDLALQIQDWNTRRSRLKTPEISGGSSLRDALSQVRVQTNGIYGARDAIAQPYMAERQALFLGLCPPADFRLIPGAGHWVQYEAAHEFNAVLLDLLDAAR